MLEIVELVQIKIKDPFLRIRKKTDPKVNIEALKETGLIIVGGGDEDGASAPIRGLPQKAEEKVLRHQLLLLSSPKNPEGKRNSVYLYKTRSQIVCLYPRWPLRRKDWCCIPSLS